MTTIIYTSAAYKTNAKLDLYLAPCKASNDQKSWLLSSDVKWSDSLDGAEGEQVSVIAHNGFVYAGANGQVFQYASDGALIDSNELPGVGYGDVNLAIFRDFLVAATNGYIVLVDLNEFGETSGNTVVSLPRCGFHSTSVTCDHAYIYAGCNGRVYQLAVDARSTRVVAVNSLANCGYKSVNLCLFKDWLVVGTNGKVLLISKRDFANTAIHSFARKSDKLSREVQLVADENFLYSSCGRSVFKINSDGKIIGQTYTDQSSDIFKLSLGRDYLYVVSSNFLVALNNNSYGEYPLTECWAVRLFGTGCQGSCDILYDSDSNNVFASAAGWIYQVDPDDGTVYANNDVHFGVDKSGVVQLAVIRGELFVGADGTVSAPIVF